MELTTLLTFRIVSIRRETETARTYQLEEINNRMPEFVPGQFLTFMIRTGKQELRRSYSILSLPGEPLQITIKKVTNGLISRFILQHWHVGDLVTALPPAGRFSLAPRQEIPRDIFCFAAGSGIIPILPQLRFLLPKETQSSICLVYSNHRESDALFLDDIARLESEYRNFRVIYLFSDPEYRHREQGHLSNLTAETLVIRELRHRREDAVFLICGPFTYMRMLIFTLGLMHFPKENIRRENYLPEIMRSGAVQEPVYPDREVSVSIGGEERTIAVPSGEPILRAALKQGLQLPYSCEGGVCGVCAARCVSGKVHMSINEVLTGQELREGWVLTCTGFPASEGIRITF